MTYTQRREAEWPSLPQDYTHTKTCGRRGCGRRGCSRRGCSRRGCGQLSTMHADDIFSKKSWILTELVPNSTMVIFPESNSDTLACTQAGFLALNGICLCSRHIFNYILLIIFIRASIVPFH